jgi:cellulose biosynthesis protein BcsQ
MNTPIIAFFNNKGGVGKTSLVYHLAWMYADLGARVLAADLDPQANLTAMFLEEERLEALWPDGNHSQTIFGCLDPMLRGIGDIGDPYLEPIQNRLALLVGDLSLSRFEDPLSEEWPKCLAGQERAFRVISAFWRIMQRAAGPHGADLILMDLGPNLGAINRAALIAADYVVIPLSPDLFSLQGLRNLGPTLRRWRGEWTERLQKKPSVDLGLPSGQMTPVGYIVQQHSVRLDRPVKAYDKWINRIPREYRESVLEVQERNPPPVSSDPHCLRLLKHYRSLMPMAQEALKPMFHLKSADGAIGAHLRAVQDARNDFEELAKEISEKARIGLSSLRLVP